MFSKGLIGYLFVIRTPTGESLIHMLIIRILVIRILVIHILVIRILVDGVLEPKRTS